MARITDLDRLLTLLQTRSQRQVARGLGVHHKTVQRWLSGEREITKARSVIVAKAAQDRSRQRREASREGYRPAPVPVQPPSHRMTRIDPTDPKAERRIWDESIAYEIARTPTDDRIAILDHYRRKAQMMGRDADVRFLVQFPPTPDYPRGRKLTEPRSIIGRRTSAQIIADAERQGVIVEMRVIDPALQ